MALNPSSLVRHQSSLLGLARQMRSFSTILPGIVSPLGRRSYSSALQPFRLNRTLPSASPQRRYLFGSSSESDSGISASSYSNLARLEQTANNNPKSPTAQNAFYSALLRAGRPDVVVARYETGRFADSAPIQAVYARASERLEQGGGVKESSGMNGQDIRSVAQSIGARYGGNATATSGAGSKRNPVYVVLEQTWGVTVLRWVRFVFSTIFTIWLAYTILSMFITLTDAGGLLRKAAGAKGEIKPEHQTTRFTDVHGCEEAKEELQEIVDFLKNPEKYSTLGGKLPKGILMVGPPGTGKTLLARAVAGEAGVPFFYMSGSDFDEVYVGVGAKRIRELFEAARTKAPAIVFIDELDAIGGKRNERDAAYSKQTLNQLLTDLDGFNQSTGVIFLAATNFPQLLDKALTRPGRFDRQVVVDLPDVRGRIAILKHYLSKISIAPKVDPSVIARGTPGFSGAELENLVNSAAIHASKRLAQSVDVLDFEWAKDKIMLGAERKSAVIQEKDKIMTAYHEGGHALVAMFTPYADPLYKATIMPRGHALGITFQLPEIDKVSMAQREYIARLDVCMGGKVAEELIYGIDATTSGASSDIKQATSVAYAMVTQMGMSPKLGNVDLHSDYNSLPQETKQVIWEEMRRLIDESTQRTTTLLTEKKVELERLASALVTYETLDKEEMEMVVRGEKLPESLRALPPGPIKLPPMPLPIGGPPPPPTGGLGQEPKEPFKGPGS